jgi:hypothetical protein
MDSTANEIEVPGLNVKGFPTIYFFPGDNKQLVKYEAGRAGGFRGVSRGACEHDVL